MRISSTVRAGFGGIGLDIRIRSLKMPLIPDRTVEEILLPEGSPQVQQPICCRGCVRFPGMDDTSNQRRRDGGKKSMYMIGHDYPGVQMISLAIKLEQRVLDQQSQTRIAQPARPKALIKVGVQMPPALPRYRFAWQSR